jgi:hypothetical protein
VSSDAKLIGVRLPGGRMAFNQLRGQRFVQAQWLEDAGLRESLAWRDVYAPGASGHCDSSHCMLRIDRANRSWVIATWQPGQPCPAADVLIAQAYATPCTPAALLFTKSSLAATGAVSFHLAENGEIKTLRTATAQRGDHAWTRSARANTAG